MNCAEWEERASLYAGGDVPAAEAAAVEAHLADCAGCQVFLSGLRQSMELLRFAHCEAVEPAHFAIVRARVMERLEAARVPWWRRTWVYGLGFATAALIAALLLWPGPAPAPPPALAVYRAPTPPVTQAPEAAPAVPAVVPAPARHRREARPDSQQKLLPAEPLVVKLVTDNPDVVIYWIADRRGE